MGGREGEKEEGSKGKREGREEQAKTTYDEKKDISKSVFKPNTNSNSTEK